MVPRRGEEEVVEGGRARKIPLSNLPVVHTSLSLSICVWCRCYSRRVYVCSCINIYTVSVHVWKYYRGRKCVFCGNSTASFLLKVTFFEIWQEFYNGKAKVNGLEWGRCQVQILWLGIIWNLCILLAKTKLIFLSILCFKKNFSSENLHWNSKEAKILQKNLRTLLICFPVKNYLWSYKYDSWTESLE